VKIIRTKRFSKLALDLNTFPNGSLDLVPGNDGLFFEIEDDTEENIKKKWKKKPKKKKKKKKTHL